MRFLTQAVCQKIDEQLMSLNAFSIDQLMELAGLSVAQAIYEEYKESKKILVCCGPGNNGGDGLVCARHLKHFGHLPTVLYPKPTEKDLYKRLLKQCEQLDIQCLEQWPSTFDHDLIVDAIFGFSFSGKVRSPFDQVLEKMKESRVPIISIDVPSGWEVDQEVQKEENLIQPSMLISLTAPKICSKSFTGVHYLGGRFVPLSLKKEYQLGLKSIPETIISSIFSSQQKMRGFIDHDPLYDAAIQRRRRFEEERRKRVLDPKLQKLAIDPDYIEKQIQEKEESRQKQRMEEQKYVSLVEQLDKVLEQVHEFKTNQARERDIQQAHENLKLNEAKPLTREYYLNRPDVLKADAPIRKGDIDPNLGISSLQVMSGEDLEHEKRLEEQRKQFRLWCHLTIKEKHQEEEMEQERKRQEIELAEKQRMLVTMVHDEQMRIRNEKNLELARINREMAEKKRREIEENERQRKQLENTSLQTPALENLEADRPHTWKYMSEEQRQKVFRDQEAMMKHKKELEEQERKQKEKEGEYVNQLVNVLEGVQEQLNHRRKNLDRQLYQENQNLAQNWKKPEKLTASPTTSFFEQFGTSSR